MRRIPPPWRASGIRCPIIWLQLRLGALLLLHGVHHLDDDLLQAVAQPPLRKVGLQFTKIGIVADVVADAVCVCVAELRGCLPLNFSIILMHSMTLAALSRPPPRLYTSPGRGFCAKCQKALITSWL